MSAPTVDVLIADRIAVLLDEALSKLVRDETGARVYPLDVAADRLHMAERTLTVWCREGLVDHTHIGRFRGMTAKQIDALAARHERKGSGAPLPAVTDELSEARTATAKGGAARRGRRVS